MNTPTPEALGARPATDRRRVLLVDDDPDIRLVTDIALSRIGGFAVRGVGTGEEALTELGLSRPDVVLVDVELPDIDGLELARRIAATPGLEGLPLIIMSGYPMDEEVKTLRPLGVVGAISKPFDPMTLAKTVKELAGWS